MDTELDLRLGKRTDITSTMRGFFINDAYRKVALEFDHPEVQATDETTLSSAADSFTVDAGDVWWPRFIRNVTDGWLLDPGQKEEIENMTKVSSAPRRYYWWGETFYVDTLADAVKTMKVWYIKTLTDLSGANESILKQEWDAVIIMNAAIIALQSVREWDEAHAQDVEANNYISKMRLPTRQAKLDDRGTGFQVRKR